MLISFFFDDLNMVGSHVHFLMQVGKRLRSLTKHPRQKIQTLASDVFELWKSVVVEEHSKTNKNNNLSSPRTPNSQGKLSIVEGNLKVGKLQTSVSVKAGESSRSPSVQVEKVVKMQKISSTESVKVESSSRENRIPVEDTSKTDNKPKPLSGTKRPPEPPAAPPRLSSMVKCNDAVRDKLRELIAEALSKVPNETSEDMIDEVNACDPIRVAVTAESILFEKLGRSNGAQKVKYRSIMFNLRDTNNPDLRRRVLTGEIKPEKLVEMSPAEMASDERKRENNQIKEKALLECERGGPPKATTDQFKCGRCGQRKTTYYQLQTRSADEPMTTFVTCVNCNNHWKFC